jgi:hypothetical protein
MAILVPGESAQLQAVRYWKGTSADLTNSASWTSSDLSVATVTNGGLVTAVGAGDAEVAASADGLRSTIGIRVTASHERLSGQIDPEVAADIVTYNQEAGYLANPHRGVIARFDLPIRVYVDLSFGRFGDCDRRAVKSWQTRTGLPIVFLDSNVEPRMEMVVLATEDYRARTVVQSVNLDNSFRAVSVILPTSKGGCTAANEDTTTHEVGHALGILGHPDWGDVMAYGVPWTGVARQPNEREVRLLVELYRLPLGAHVEPDGTWVVR